MNSRIATQLTQIEGLPPELQKRLSELLDAYLTGLEQQRPLDRDQLLTDNPDLAEPLAEYLDSLELLQDAAVGFEPVFDGLGRSDSADPDARRIGEFRIVREVGRGGMGVVYEAWEEPLHRRVALKVLPFNTLVDARQIARFRNEAQAAAQLQHPRIVPVYAVGTDRGVHYYAMRFIDGQPLDQVIAKLREVGRGGDSGSRPTPNGPTPNGLQPLGPTDPTQRDKTQPAKPPHGMPTLGWGPLGFLSGQQADDEPRRDPPATRPVPKEPEPATGKPGSVPTDLTQLDETRPVEHRDSDDARPFEFSRSLAARYTGDPRAYFRAVAELGIQVAEALQAAHEEGVIHRDIKPSNLLLDSAGGLWITDFGLARCRDDVRLTRTGDLIGTIRYMSPEQTRGRAEVLDHRTDIYSLGLTLYELLTLRPAHRGEDAAAVLRQLDRDQPYRLRIWNARIPSDLENIVQKAMAKSREQRYATAGELAADLRNFLAGRPTMARRPTLLEHFGKWARRQYRVLIGLLALLLLAVGGLLAANILLSRERDETRAAAESARENYQMYRSQLATTKLNLALVQLEHGNSAAAESLLNEAISHQAAVLQEQADAFDTLRELSMSFSNLASLYESTSPERAASCYRTSVVLQQKLIASSSPTADEDAEYRAFLGVTLSNLGSLYRRQGDLGLASEAYRQSLAVLRPLARRSAWADRTEPGDRAGQEGRFRRDLAVALNNLGMTQAALGRLDEAEQAYREALGQFPAPLEPRDSPRGGQPEIEQPEIGQPEIGQPEVEQPGGGAGPVDDWSILAPMHFNLGYVLEHQQRWVEAAAQYERAVTYQAAVVRWGPPSPDQTRVLCLYYRQAGRVLHRLGNHRKALEYAGRRIPLCRGDTSRLWRIMEDLAMLVNDNDTVNANAGSQEPDRNAARPAEPVDQEPVIARVVELLPILAELGVDVRAEIDNNQRLRSLRSQPAVEQWLARHSAHSSPGTVFP